MAHYSVLQVSSIQISLVHNHHKAMNKCYTQDNTNTLENPRVRIGTMEEKTFPDLATHPPWNPEHNQSHPARSNTGYVTRIK